MTKCKYMQSHVLHACKLSQANVCFKYCPLLNLTLLLLANFEFLLIINFSNIDFGVYAQFIYIYTCMLYISTVYIYYKV